MGSKERISRLKEETRCNILDASLQIAQKEGWQALSMRKIADEIEYTAPIIYEYFPNKEGILAELTRKGYLILAKDVREAKAKHDKPEQQLEAMWVAYWNFAFANREFYQLMFGVEMICCNGKNGMEEADLVQKSMCVVIRQLYKEPVSEKEVSRKYYTFWSIIHGLISINLVNRGMNEEINQSILKDAIVGIIRSING
ncbi:TetR family transcriptional regulator [Pedobacter yulinensis]|uniref:TetR family transcriptional regulator n=1 Tax=Pedobacter yulinensis TaxID=2126353 RepID=A0A2T3HJK6_9SPHI|nr:TetR/AcrR family transcriptional regulator [Pedobacter yulinensis]PST82622.1 TetR family transcriptional regulator [Pedobacter yulinensis]